MQEQTEGTSTRGYLSYGFGIEDIEGVGSGTLYNFQGELYSVTAALVKIAQDHTETTIGNLPSVGGEGAPFVADNGETLAIVFPGGYSYFYDTENGIVQITDPAFQAYEGEEGGVRGVVRVSGVFVFWTKSTLFSGSIATDNKGQDFDALDFVEPFLDDDIQRGINLRDELYVFGNDRCRPYGVAVTGSFPFAEIGGAGFDKGLASPYAIQRFDNSLVFVGGGQNEQSNVWRVLGAGAVSKISTPFIDSKIADLINPEEWHYSTSSFAFNFDGHFYFGFTFGSILTGETYVYDATSSAIKGRHMWHRRKYGALADDITPWTVTSITEAYGKFYTSDYYGGLGRIDKDIYTEYGVTPEREFSGYYLANQRRPVFIDRVELICESGVGKEWLNRHMVGRTPEIELWISDDGGRTFNSAGSRQLGVFQDYTARTVWDALGYSEQGRLFKFTCSAPVKQVFLKLLATLEEGN